MKLWLRLLLMALMTLSTACVWQPLSYSEKTARGVEDALAKFRAQPALEIFFDEAVAYAVFPASVRAGTGFGAALGSGWLFEQGVLSGRLSLIEVFAGVNFGAQSYRSILFFRNAKSVDKFKKGRFEFTGQANAAAMSKGGGLTPSFNQDVALFTQLRGGLLIEASIGSQRYDFFPSSDTEGD